MKEPKTTEKTYVTTALPPLPSAFTLFRSSLQALGTNIWTFVLLFAIPSIFLVAGSILDYIGGGMHGTIPALFWIGVALMGIGGLLTILAMPALMMTQIRSAAGKLYEVDAALRDGFHIFWRYLGIMIALVVIFAVSFALLIVPFFFAIRRYLLAPYYLADHDCSIKEALRRSAADSQNFKGAIWGLIGVQTLNGFVAYLPLFGWAINASYYCAPAARYLQIKEAAVALAELNKKFNR